MEGGDGSVEEYYDKPQYIEMDVMRKNIDGNVEMNWMLKMRILMHRDLLEIMKMTLMLVLMISFNELYTESLFIHYKLS